MSITQYTLDSNSTSYPAETAQDTLYASAYSNVNDKPDFKYVFDVYANGNQLTRVKLYPDPVNGFGYFDAGPSVRNEMNYEWFTAQAYTNATNPGIQESLITEPSQTGQIAINYDIRFGEEYISGGVYVSGSYVSGGTLVTLLNEVSGTKKVYNYAAPLFNRKSIRISDLNNKYLTNRPKKANCKLNGNLLIPIKLPANSNKYIGFKIIQYNQANTSFDTFSSQIDGPFYSALCNEFYQLNIGPSALNILLDSAGKNTISNQCKFYDIAIEDTDTGNAISEYFRVYIDCNPKYDAIDLYFMNQWGMFDTARFDLSSRLSMDIERKSFTKKDWNLVSDNINYFPRQETKINYGSKMNWTYKLTMNYPTDEEYVWLSELITSPQIYAKFPEVNDFNGIVTNATISLMPVTIKNTNYEYSTNQNNGLKVLEIEVELNQTRYGFLR